MERTEYLALDVPQRHVKTVKDLLEGKGLLNKKIKIAPAQQINSISNQEQLYVIPTTLTNSMRHTADDEQLCEGTIAGSSFLNDWLMRCSKQNPALRDSVKIISVPMVDADKLKPRRANLLRNALLGVLQQINIIEHSAAQIPLFLERVSFSYCIYPPLLLLPLHSAADQSLQSFIDSLDESTRRVFLQHIASELHISHIANNAPIPLHNNPSPSSGDNTPSDNILRSPTNFTPLYGDFGPALAPFPEHIPTLIDYEQALWVSVVQNGITQTWAPRYTMFSSGNVTEKARILNLPSVKQAVEDGQDFGGCTAVDLFAGIGYFAFSYARAGVSKVLCWDLNPWSTEGLRRGARLNKWSTYTINEPLIYGPGQDVEEFATFDVPPVALLQSTRLILFQESNEQARVRIPVLRQVGLPPIRHVNCGMLPDAFSALLAAIEAVDPVLGGWVHFHQVVGEGLEMTKEVGKTVSAFESILKDMRSRMGLSDEEEGGQVVLEHVERVKSVAPKRWHVVLDIWVRVGEGAASKGLPKTNRF